MAYNNQFGPPAAAPYQPKPHHPSRHPDSQYQGYHRADDDRQYDSPYHHDNYDDFNSSSRSPPQPPAHSPYRDMHSPSPDLHPGIAPPSRVQPSYSPPREQDSHSQRGAYGPVAGAAAAGAGLGAGSRALNEQEAPFLPPGNMGKYATYGGQQSPSNPDMRNGDYDNGGRNSPYSPYSNSRSQAQSSHASYSSADQLTSSAAPPSMALPAHGGYQNGAYNGNGGYGGPFNDRNDSPSRFGGAHYNPYDAHSISRNNLNGLDYVDPAVLADDGDDGLGPANPKRRSMISLGRHSMRSNPQVNALGAAAVGGAAAAGASRGVAEHYGSNGSRDQVGAEKAVDPFVPFQHEKKKNGWKKWLFIVIGILILGGIAGGVAGGLIESKKSGSGSNGGGGSSGNPMQDASGDYSKDSPRVKELLNNKNLHKVFMGMAYTPLNTQYPDCLTNKPIQNNVTMDMAVIGQLTNTVRLYGTDCNQTEMVLHAIDRLGLTNMKVWLGVWLGNNDTTNTRQMSQMYTILDSYGTKNIKGVVVGNEVLFRKDLTATQLGTILQGVKANMTAKYNSLPVASSDLGDNWTTDLASQVDVIMSNVHPFFGGVTVDQAASWTWNFWQSHDVALTQGLTGKTHVISEIGWPSQGGNDCGGAKCPDKTSGAVSGITQMNTFMSSWVCQALANGTEYFWFEAYDEPWKIQYDTADQAWEDHWGMFDVNRNLKSGLKLPDCGGKLVS